MIPTNRASCLADGFAGSPIDLREFGVAPKPFDEHIVPPDPFAIRADGRRNSLFSGSEGGAESWAILAPLVNTAKLHELDPQAY